MLAGLDALFAGTPMAQTPRGGAETGFDGITYGRTAAQRSGVGAQQTPQPPDYTGLGALLEANDAKLYRGLDALVRRQEQLAMNRLACDTHYTLVKLGYPWSILEKDPGKSRYRQSLPYGAKAISIQAVPNKAWDLVNKTAEALLVDFPEVECQPTDDSEQAQATCEIANRFLAQDATEQGTNDAVLYYDRVNRALTTASSFVEYWVDPAGGGYLPLQIKAHPQALIPQNPLVGPDGMPTTDYVLRYVTTDGQFTDDASQAALSWQPKIRASKWEREHVRTYPETAGAHDAEKVLILGYCTLSEARRRWPAVAAMSPDDLTALTDWTPPRYLVLLPPFLRARWKLSDSSLQSTQRGGTGASDADERVMFYYHLYIRACPDYPRGADLVVSGTGGGRAIHRGLLSADVEVDRSHETGPMRETRCMEIPVVQVTPYADPDESDPMGRCYMERFAGAAEHNAFLAMSFAEVLTKNLHLEGYINATSPVDGTQREEARVSGDLIPITRPGDVPVWGPSVAMPAEFFEFYNFADEAINSIAARERAAQGADTSKERSGKALQIAVSQNSIGSTSPLNAIMNAYARSCRIKIELAMATFRAPQQMSYVGEDGAYTQDEWSGTDFALVGKVAVKAGTGTMLAPDQKVQYLAGLSQSGLLTKEEVADAARQTFAKKLGIPADPHEQYVERCVEAWLKGPPAPAPNAPKNPQTGQPQTWAEQYQAWHAAQQQFQQATAQYQQQLQAYQAAQRNTAIVAGGPPPPKLGPESQNEKAMYDYQAAVIALQANPLPSQPPVAPQPPQVPKPWVPFVARPNDTEPAVAAIWRTKLSATMSTVKYGAFGPEWQDVLIQQYDLTRRAEAVGQTAQAQVGATQPTESKPAKGGKRKAA